MKKRTFIAPVLCTLALCTGLLVAGQRSPKSLVKQQLEKYLVMT